MRIPNDEHGNVDGINDDFPVRWLFPCLSMWISNFLLASFLVEDFEQSLPLLRDDDDENVVVVVVAGDEQWCDEDVRMFLVIQLNDLEMVMKNHDSSFDLTD